MSRSILIVDNSVALVQFLQRKLEEAFPTAEVTTSKLANDAYNRSTSLRPDVVVVDYALPDLKGDEFCRMLSQNPATSLTPIILLYGDGVDAEKIRQGNPNVVAAVQKPFEPEALVSSIKYIFSQPRIAMEIKSRFDVTGHSELGFASSKVLFRANTELLPLGTALRYVSDEKLSGVLRILLKKHPIEIICSHGKVAIATTKDLQLYCLDSPLRTTGVERDRMAMAAKGQMDSGCPYFVLLALHGLFPQEQVSAQVRSHGARLVARALLAGKVFFEFEDANTLPEYAREFHEHALDSYVFALACARELPGDKVETLRCSEMAGTPAFTPAGEKLLTRLPLDSGEEAFIKQVNGRKTLGEICRAGNLAQADALALAFLFHELGVLQFWTPGSQRAETGGDTRPESSV